MSKTPRTVIQFSIKCWKTWTAFVVKYQKESIKPLILQNTKDFLKDNPIFPEITRTHWKISSLLPNIGRIFKVPTYHWGIFLISLSDESRTSRPNGCHSGNDPEAGRGRVGLTARRIGARREGLTGGDWRENTCGGGKVKSHQSWWSRRKEF